MPEFSGPKSRMVNFPVTTNPISVNPARATRIPIPIAEET